jgi:hypothetical protein
MVLRRDATCPLCGAKLSPALVLDTCEEFADAALGALSGRCPFCQGHIDVQPREGSVAIGYVQYGRFEAIVMLPAEGLVALRDTASGSMRLRMSWRDWRFEP